MSAPANLPPSSGMLSSPNMCGFGVVINPDGIGSEERQIVDSMAKTLEARGPDGFGFYSNDEIATCHQRLKIIDLSEKGRQPMWDSELRVGVSFNGCIYNHRELRKELEEQGYRFFSTSDTEILIKGYHSWGISFVERLNGMFAFFLWDETKKKRYLARDRLGIKPLYLSKKGQALYASSSLPAIMKATGKRLELDREALDLYLSFHSVVPAPKTLFKEITKLEPASFAEVSKNGELLKTNYWEPRYGTPPEKRSWSRAQWVEAAENELRQSVRRRLVADVPVGVLLSGGVDSSVITALVAEETPELSTFSIGFHAEGDEVGDEFKYSDLVAEAFKTDHHQLQIDPGETLSSLDQCITAMSEPMMSHDNVGFFLLSREVSKHVKVVQSGQGADEVFAGYHWYPPLLDTNDPLACYQGAFFDREKSQRTWLLKKEYACEEDIALEFVKNHFARKGAQHPLDKALRIDTNVMLVDDPVKRVDNATMAWGLEARVPFLDHELVEFAAQLPTELKVAHEEKHLLKEVARKLVPRAVVDRPKGYFPVPALKYFRGSFLDYAKETLSQSFSDNRIFSPEAIREIINDPDRHITQMRGSTLWQMCVLQRWAGLQGLDLR